MGLDLGRHLLDGLHPDPTVEVVGDGGDDQDDDRRGKQPVDEELQERQLEHVETDVPVELRVLGAEGHVVGEQDPLVPVAGDAGPGDQREQGRYERAHEQGAGADDLVVALDQLFFRPHGTEGRRDAVGDGEVHPHQHEEEDGEQDGEAHLGAQDPAPHAGEVELLEPEVIGVEAGYAAQGDDQEEDDDRGHQQAHAATGGADTPCSRHVG